VNERGYYHGTMCNEVLIEVGESKKTLNITHKSWGNLIPNGWDLIKIHENAISKNKIFKKFHFNLMEFAFLQFNIQSNSFKLVQNKPNILFIFLLVLGKNEDVIDVTNHKFIQVFMENIIHQVLKDNMGISKAKRHHHIFKMARINSKNKFSFITFPNTHQGTCTM
jgi:hypothetical protein